MRYRGQMCTFADEEAAKALYAIIRTVFGLETKTPTLAIDKELSIPPLDLYVKQRQDMLALTAYNLD